LHRCSSHTKGAPWSGNQAIPEEHLARPFDSALAGSVKESAQQIWLAGMGAFAKAR
jgi:hypothetical protein